VVLDLGEGFFSHDKSTWHWLSGRGNSKEDKIHGKVKDKECFAS
jgi:hypothetical protein